MQPRVIKPLLYLSSTPATVTIWVPSAEDGLTLQGMLHPLSRLCAVATVEQISVGTRLEDMERRLIEATLEQCGGHRAKAAQALGIGIRTLTNKLRLYGYAPRARTFGKVA